MRQQANAAFGLSLLKPERDQTMTVRLSIVVVLSLAICLAVTTGEGADWWDPGWRLRTTVGRATPYRSDSPRPVEIAVDFPLLLDRAGVAGRFDPGSLRVVERDGDGPGREVPFVYRTEFNARERHQRTYLAWIARAQPGKVGEFDIYFDTTDGGIKAGRYDGKLLPPENLLVNPGFEDQIDGRPAEWTLSSSALACLDKFGHTTGKRSLKIVVDQNTSKEAPREIVISQKIDVKKFAGREMVFECDLLAERAIYGAPASIELQQFRGDGSRILEHAVQPRWLTLELAEGQLVQFCQRGRFSPEVASVDVRVRIRCLVRDADTAKTVTGPESFFTVWLDRVVVRPGERWSWPAASNAGFAQGALNTAPLNRGFQFIGQRRLAFCGASKGTLTAGKYNPCPRSVHWGLEKGTLEFWCRPSWDSDDGVERIFFIGYADYYRVQSRLRKLGADGNNVLEFSIADASGTPSLLADPELRTASGPATLRAGRWHHIAATWDFPKAQLRLFVDGKLVGAQGPGEKPWPSSLIAVGGAKKTKGVGISSTDTRSLPMQAFVGGRVIEKKWPKGDAAEAVLDELRISDVVRYTGKFTPPREEFVVDKNTRALFHFENEKHGIHDADDRFVRGYLGCELPPQQEEVILDVLNNGKVEHRTVVVKPHAPTELFDANRGENRLPFVRPVRTLPDPRFIEYRRRHVERVVDAANDGFAVTVGGDLEPLMRSITFERAAGSGTQTTSLPRWRANHNVVPFSVKDLRTTLFTDAPDDAEKAIETFKYILQTGDYYDAHYCETLPGGRHRPRVSYVFLKALNIYPFDQCGPQNYTLRKLFLAAGISSNNAPGTHHQFQQAYYHGDWRLFDLAARMYWLNRDNRTVLGQPGLGEDPYLRLRGTTVVNSYFPGHVGGAAFGSAWRPHRMDFPLRPGERASICWHNEGRWFEVTGPDRSAIRLAKIPPYFGNGAIVYEPTPEGEAAVLENMVLETLDDASRVIRAQDPAKPAALIYRVECPYIFSDGQIAGRYAARNVGAVSLSLSFDEGMSWATLWRSPEKKGQIAADLLKHVTGRYAYRLKVELAAGQTATVADLLVRTVFVEAPRSLPGKLSLGKNRISFVGGPATAPVKTSCFWVERHLSKLGVSLNSTSYYNLDSEEHRNLLVATSGKELPLRVAVTGRELRGHVSLENLPKNWSANTLERSVELADPTGMATIEFALRPDGAEEGDVHCFDVVVRGPNAERRMPAQVIVANTPLVREAEQAEKISGNAVVVDIPELSGGRGVAFKGSGKLAFSVNNPLPGKYTLWLRARWELGTDGVVPVPPQPVELLARYTPDSKPALSLRLDEGNLRELRPMGMRGFMDGTLPGYAYTKKFYGYGKAHEHWAWYRIPDVELAAGKHRLTLGAIKGTYFDALLLLPQNPVMDRTAMNLFHNWNYAPWNNPL